MPSLSSLTAAARARWTRIEAALRARPLLWALVLSAVIAAAFSLTLSPGYETNDDVGMQSTVDGTYFGEPLPHLIFSNVLIGLLLSTLYRAVAWFPWYGLYLYLAHFAALLVAIYVVLAIRQGRLWVRLLGLAAVLSVFHVPMWMQLQFTSTAILLGASGVVLYWAAGRRTPVHWSAIAVGGAMVGFSSWIRWHSGVVAILLALPVLALSVRRIPWRRQALFAATAAAIVAVGFASQALYYHGQADWQAYFDFNSTRGELLQSPDLGNVGPAVLTEVGWSLNDLRMFQRWFFTDDDVFQAADLDVIAEAVPTSFRWGNAARALTDQARGWLGGLRVATIATLAALAWAEGNRHERQVALAGIAAVAAVAFVLAGTAKLPSRVGLPMLAFAALLCLPGPHPDGETERTGGGLTLRTWRSVTVVVSAMAILVGTAHALDLDETQHGADARLRKVLSALEEIDPDGLFVSWGAQLPLNGQSLSPWQRGGLEGPTLLGLGWQERSPMDRAMLASRGIDDLYTTIASRADVYLPLSNPRPGLLYLTYLREHYGFSGLLRPIGSVAQYTVYNLAVAYRVSDSRGALVEHHLDGTRVAYRLAETGVAAEAAVLSGEDGSLLIVGRATADLIVVTDPTNAIALARPADPGGETDAGSFAITVPDAPEDFRLFALSGNIAVEITP